MPDATEIKILLRTIADLTGLVQTQQAVAGTTAEFEAASAASGEFASILGGLAGGLAFAGVGALVGLLTQIPSLIAQSNEEWRKADEETSKASAQLSEQIVIWDQLAMGATTFSDVVSLAGKGIAELTKLSKELEEAQSKQLTTFQKIQDAFNPGAGPHGGGGIGSNAQAKADGTQRRKDTLSQGFDELIAKEDKADAAFNARMDRLNEPPTQALQETTAELTKQEEVLDSIDRRTLDGQKAYASQLKVVENLRSESEKFGKGQEKASQEAGDFSLKQRQAALDQARLNGENVAGAQHQLSVEQKVAELTKSKADALKDGRITQADINALAEREVTVAEQKRAASAANRSSAEGERAAHQQISALLTEENQKLQQIRGDLSSIESNPFLSIDQKNAASAQLIPQAIAQLNQQIQQNKSIQAGSALDPVQWQRVQGAIQSSEREIAKYQIQLQLASSPTKQLQANLTAWANQFGTTAHQIGNAITTSIGGAVNGISNALTGLIFKTTSWKQAFASAAESIVGSIIQIAVQWAVSRAVMAALNLAFGKTETASSNAEAAASAAAWSPAAVAASTASFGAAAGAGNLAYIAALVSGTAFATGLAASGGAGGFAAGGFTGEGNPREVAGLVHRGEFVMSAAAVRRAGLGNLENLHVNLTRPSYEAGGFVGIPPTSSGRTAAAAPQIHQALFFDIKTARKWLLDRTGQKEIIDIVNGAGGHLRS